MKLAIRETYNEVAYKGLLAPKEYWIKFLNDEAEEKIHNHFLVLSRALLPKAIFFNDHVEIVSNCFIGSLPEQFTHRTWHVVREA